MQAEKPSSGSAPSVAPGAAIASSPRSARVVAVAVGRHGRQAVERAAQDDEDEARFAVSRCRAKASRDVEQGAAGGERTGGAGNSRRCIGA